MRRLLLTLITVAVLALSACSGSKQPSNSDLSKMSTAYFNKQFNGLFVVTSVFKDNGYKQNDTHYVAEMNIAARAERSLDEYAQDLMNNSSLSAFEKMTTGMAVGLLKMTMPDFVAGDVLDFKRDYLFIKTDKGWLLKKELNDETTD